ncbi:OsmC family protein [Mesonia sp. K7]|uniref:OsmC family protein n=1 Tax=Mesonia sp. K7 TaxID=2218606 RepID=UPI000DA79B83|nr:OsmC family protein [Mesonia sp. K7]PZD76510.1 hypothetical protein DNG35_11875 [Mesonia sp. K7]
MKSEIQKFIVENANTKEGVLFLPTSGKPKSFVLVVDNFEERKSTLSEIAKPITQLGIGVFAITFSGEKKVADLNLLDFHALASEIEYASRFLAENHMPISVVFGHSFAGISALLATPDLETAKAVFTLNTPRFFPDVVSQETDEILENLEKKAALFPLEILQKIEIPHHILHDKNYKKITCRNAEILFEQATEPKRLKIHESENALKESVNYLTNWIKENLETSEEKNDESLADIVATLKKEDGFTTKIKAGEHEFLADEPKSMGGKDQGPTPYDLLSAGLSACTVMTIQMYAKRKKMSLDTVEVHTTYSNDHLEDCENCEEEEAKIDVFTRKIKFSGDLSETEIKKLLQIADKCPVHKTLITKTDIKTELIN